MSNILIKTSNESQILKTSGIKFKGDVYNAFLNTSISYNEFCWLYKGQRSVKIQDEWKSYQSNKILWLNNLNKYVARSVLSFLNTKKA